MLRVALPLHNYFKNKWLTGPQFLWKNGTFQPEKTEELQVTESDPEVRKAVVFTSPAESLATQPSESSMLSRLCQILSWQRLLKALALCLRVKSRLASRGVKRTTQTGCQNKAFAKGFSHLDRTA